MDFLFKLICPVLVVASIYYSFYQKSEFEKEIKELTYKAGSSETENSRLEARLKVQSERISESGNAENVLKKELGKTLAESEKLKVELENLKGKLAGLATEAGELKKLLVAETKARKAAEQKAAEAVKNPEPVAVQKKQTEFVLTQDVYIKRFQSITARLTANLSIAQAKDPDRGKKSAGKLGVSVSELSLPHIRAAEKVLRELEAKGEPSQKLYSVLAAEKQRWASERSRWEYIPACSAQLRKDVEQFESPKPTYLDEI